MYLSTGVNVFINTMMCQCIYQHDDFFTVHNYIRILGVHVFINNHSLYQYRFPGVSLLSLLFHQSSLGRSDDPAFFLCLMEGSLFSIISFFVGSIFATYFALPSINPGTYAESIPN